MKYGDDKNNSMGFVEKFVKGVSLATEKKLSFCRKHTDAAKWNHLDETYNIVNNIH